MALDSAELTASLPAGNGRFGHSITQSYSIFLYPQKKMGVCDTRFSKATNFLIRWAAFEYNLILLLWHKNKRDQVGSNWQPWDCRQAILISPHCLESQGRLSVWSHFSISPLFIFCLVLSLLFCLIFVCFRPILLTSFSINIHFPVLSIAWLLFFVCCWAV